MFDIKMGVPEMEKFWYELREKNANKTASPDEISLYKKLGKTFYYISINPRHTGLHSHDIDELTVRFGEKVWQSYIENNTPSAGRVFWVYGPGKEEITIIGVEPHPNDKSSYKRITLSKIGEKIE